MRSFFQRSHDTLRAFIDGPAAGGVWLPAVHVIPLYNNVR
jgi:hypothetical protein